MNPDIIERDIFLLECSEIRHKFVEAVQLMPWNNRLRTQSESLLIMFDQMTEMVHKGDFNINGIENDRTESEI